MQSPAGRATGAIPILRYNEGEGIFSLRRGEEKMWAMMRGVNVPSVFIALCLLATGQSPAANPSPPSNAEVSPPAGQGADPCPDAGVLSDVYFSISGKVVDVVDGDTITIRVKNRRKLIHLVGIDAPAIGETAGEESRKHL